MESKIKAMIAVWKEEYSSIREYLIINNQDTGGRYYMIQMAEALRLCECIVDATELLINDDDEKH